MSVQLKDGIIELDTSFADEIGFTSGNFDGWLWCNGKHIYISCIESKHPNQGNLSKLFDAIMAKGYGIKIPPPFPKMEQIAIHKGFKLTIEKDDDSGESCYVYVKDVV